MGPYQTLRAHTLCTQLLVSFRVFFDFKNPEKHKKWFQGMPRLLAEWGFTKIHGFPGFGSKDLSNAKDDKTKNDAMVNVYPLECPKPIISLDKLKNQDVG